MVTTILQIVLILLLISILGILIGYILGKLFCIRAESSTLIEKGAICEENYNENLLENEDKNVTKSSNLALENDSVSVEESIQKESKSEDSSKPQSLISTNNETVLDNNRDSESKELEADKSNASTKDDRASADKNESSVEDESQTAKPNEQDSQNINAQTQENSSKDSNEQMNKDDESSSESASSKDLEQSADKDSDNNLNSDEENAPQETEKPQTLLSEPKNGKADNLCKIKGVGKVIEAKLHNLGIYHFEQIASFTQKEIAWVDEHLSFKGRIIREDWIGQAKILAKGEETEFSKRVEKGEVESSK